MNDGFKIYTTGILYGLGRILVVITSQYEPNGQDLTAEAYLFSLDVGREGGRYKGCRVVYRYNPEIQDAVTIDPEFMEEEAKRSAKNIISKTQHAEYLKTKDQNFMGRPADLFECDKNELVSLKGLDGYADRLRHIADDTRSEGLRKYLKLILRMPTFEVQEFE